MYKKPNTVYGVRLACGSLEPSLCYNYNKHLQLHGSIIFRQSLIFTIPEEKLNGSFCGLRSPQEALYCCVEKSVKCFAEMSNKRNFLKIINLYKDFLTTAAEVSLNFFVFSCFTKTTQNKNTFYHYIFCGTPALDPPHSHSKAWTLLTFYLLRRHE